jgi:serine/threonine protein kinase
MEKFKIEKKIGDGTYGSVLKALNTQTGEEVAIKQMKKKFASWDECINLREIKCLRKLNHPNLIKLKEVVKLHDELNLIFENLDQNIYQYYMGFRDK